MSRRRLGARLARWTALTATGALLLFGLTTAVVVWSHETAEEAGKTEPEEDPFDEAISQLAIPIAVTAPVVLALAFFTTRRIARRVTDRLDGVVAAAHLLTHENLSERLPTSAAGDELDELATALNGLFGRLEEGIAAQQQFVADASHELRTPLTVLSSNLEVARRRPRTPDEWEAVADRARAEVARMTAMVEALLRLTRASGTPPGEALVDGRALVEEVAARWAAAAENASVRLTATADGVAVTGDSDALAVALGNLVSNAIAHSPKGGLVAVHARRVGVEAELAVTDQGPGVPLPERERIFLPFARGTTAADRRVDDGGVGLGLSVARRIVEAHRGVLLVDDAPGGGARFLARLPAT